MDDFFEYGQIMFYHPDDIGHRPRAIDEVRAEQRRMRQAQERAEKLLLSNLNSVQRGHYTRTKMFEVEGASGTVYRLKGNVGSSNNIRVYPPQQPAWKFWKYVRSPHYICLVPLVQVPIEDQLLAQKMMLELDERRARRIAYPPACI